jgi:hypothetical protein
VPSSFYPSGGSEKSFELNTITKPLEPYKNDLVILKGLDHAAAFDSPVKGHMAMAVMLTGAPMLQDKTFSVTYNEGKPNEVTKYYGWGSAPSVDQIVAAEIGQNTLLQSLELGVRVDYDGTPGRPNYRMCYAGSNQPIAPDDNPLSVFDRLFGNIGIDSAEADSIRARRLSVMDHLGGELTSLRNRLSASERHKLESHLDSIRELEKRLQTSLVACEPEPVSLSGSHGSGSKFPEVTAAQMDLIAQAFSCDATRVATLQLASENGAPSATWLGHDPGNYSHKLSHAAQGEAMFEQFIEYSRWYASQLAALVQRLKAIDNGDGTSVMDDTLIVWTHAIGMGNVHSNKDVPAVLIGNAGGAFETGRYLSLGGIPNNHLLVSICQAMGLDRDWVGDKKYGTGPIPGL